VIARNPCIEVIRPGTSVLIGGDIEATVLAAIIRSADGTNVNYECRWFDGAISTVDTFAEFEVVPVDDNGKKTAVGFQ